jgi:non-specific serine/threonine protein kinase
LDPQLETRALYKKIRKGEIKQVQIEKQIEPIPLRHNLPLQISTFIGREKAQGEIIALLAKNRLVTLVGAGGIGKTRMSLESGKKVVGDYPHGVWFIPLDSLSDPTLVPQTVASIFDLREGADRPVIETLIYVLREKTALLILDNCEHLLNACTQLVTKLLTNCPNLKVLVTSRETLRLKGEATYYLPSLSIPEDSNLSIEKLSHYESIQLFTERAALAVSSFTLTEENARTVADICHRLDGIPLAIELAAARVNILQVKEIQKQLEDSFSLLTSDGDPTIQRHQTLHASMDWSWQLLTESEQKFLRQLSVFAGGWTLESAQTVCERNTLNLMSALVKKSLITVDRKAGVETRYRFHEIVRQYLGERLLDSGEEEEIRTRHLQYFLRVSEQAETALRGPTQVEWMSRLNDEHDNIRAAMNWADQTDVEAGLYLSSRLHRAWEEVDFREGNYWLPKFLQKPESYAYPSGRAKALHAYTWILDSLEQRDAARSSAQECLELYRALGDQQGEVDGLLSLGWELTHPPEKLALIRQALTLAQSLGDLGRQAKALWLLGWLDRGHQFAHWKKAIALDRQLGDWLRLANRLCTMGYFLIQNGDIDSAQKHLDEANLLNQQLKLKSVRANLFFGYGQIALFQGDFEKARTYLQENAKIFFEFGNRLQYLWARVHLAYIALRERNLSEARDIFAETAQDFQKDENIIGVVFTLEGVASLYLVTDSPVNAARLIGWADATRKQIDDTRPGLEQADVDKMITACVAKMGEAAFSDAYDEGQEITLDEAVAYALEVKG